MAVTGIVDERIDRTDRLFHASNGTWNGVDIRQVELQGMSSSRS